MDSPRIAPTIELHLINEQAGFRPGKSFASQLLKYILLIQKLYNTRQHTMCITAQYHTVYRNNSLLVTSDKTQVTAFHLRNRETKKSLKVSWNGVDLENTAKSKYLGVTFDRTLSYKQHIQNTKMKVDTRNDLLNKVASSKWGTNTSTTRTTALPCTTQSQTYWTQN